MSRYTGPKQRLCRREGTHLHLKGRSCEDGKCSLNKKQQAPGMHGNSKSRPSTFGQQLREKQRIKRSYGLLEKSFRRYFEEAVRQKGVTTEIMLRLLEERLDNVVYRLGLTASRSASRKFVTEGKVLVNDKVVKAPGCQVKAGDKVTTAFAPAIPEGYKVPLWLSYDQSKNLGQVVESPKREQIDADFKEQLVVEFYSR